MPVLQYTNNWGAQNSQLDPLRPDLFRVQLQIPQQVLGGGSGLWDSEVSFAIKSFPFPAREREMIPIKWLQQTNYVIGADVGLQPVELNVRWAFNRRTVEILERWYQLTANAQNGGVAITSLIKTNGFLYFLIPSMNAVADPTDTANDAFVDGPRWYLEGVLIKGLKVAENLDMGVGNEIVTVNFSIQMDRMYPLDPSDLSFLPGATNNSFVPST
jgi:hypothetical protein